MQHQTGAPSNTQAAYTRAGALSCGPLFGGVLAGVAGLDEVSNPDPTLDHLAYDIDQCLPLFDFDRMNGTLERRR
jgi:hypothetical protein